MGRLFEELTSDFSSGMFDSVASTRFPRAAAGSIVNGRMQADGTVRRRWGSIRTHPTLLNAGTCFGAIEFRTAAGVDQIVAFFGAKAFRSIDEGATWAEIASGLRLDYYTFATMRVGAAMYLFAANGDTSIKRWDGTTWDTLPGPPSGVKFIAVANGRLWATGHSGVIVQASRIADPTNWTSPFGLTVQVLTHDGDPPTGLYQIGPHLLVWDRNSTSYISGYGEQTIIVASGAEGFSRSVGCVAFRTIVAVGDNAISWLSERGIEYYRVGGQIQLVSKPIQRFLSTIDWEELYSNPGRPSAVYDEINQDYLCAISTSGAQNNNVVVLNLRQREAEFERPGPRAAASIDALASPTVGDLFFGGDGDGFLTAVGGGQAMKADANGYATLGAVGSGDPISADGDGYLASVTNDTLPATLFRAHYQGLHVVMSGGYDGFVRRHYGVGSDDMLSNGTGGTPVTMTIVTRPFLFRNPRQRKRVRAIHIAVISSSQATISVLTRSASKSTAAKSVVIPASLVDNQAQRKQVREYVDGDAPQVEARTSDDIRIALLGVSVEKLRERIGA